MNNCVNCRFYEYDPAIEKKCAACMQAHAIAGGYPKWKSRTLIQRLRTIAKRRKRRCV